MNITNIALTAGAIRSSLYIDPAATTVLISSISAIAVAVGASVIIWWRKAKKKVGSALHIDENAKKEVEEDIQVFDDNNEEN